MDGKKGIFKTVESEEHLEEASGGDVNESQVKVKCNKY